MGQRGTHTDKLFRISQYTFHKFVTATDSNITVHDIHLRRWALQAKPEEDLSSFITSRKWLRNSKKANGIFSRKITKLITRTTTQQEENLILVCDAFVNEVKSQIMYNSSENVFNPE